MCHRTMQLHVLGTRGDADGTAPLESTHSLVPSFLGASKGPSSELMDSLRLEKLSRIIRSSHSPSSVKATTKLCPQVPHL